MMTNTNTTAVETFVAYPRDGYNSFAPVVKPTVEGARDAGLATGKPFDVHSSTGAVVWVWEQR